MAKKQKIVQYTITEVARATKLSAEEIWEYIGEGLIQPYSDEKKGFLYFTEEQMEVLKRIAGV